MKYKHVVEDIVKYLKINNIRFSECWEGVEEHGMVILTIYIGSSESSMQIEGLNSTEENDSLCMTFGTCDDNGYADNIFSQTVWCITKFEDTEDGLLSLIEVTKLKSKIVSKIERKIEDIQELCDELNVDISQFITVNYNF